MPLRDKGFQFEVKSEPAQTTIFLKGPIDEHAKLVTVLEPSGTLVFNFKDVTLLNSRGIVSWQKFLDKLRSSKIYLDECPTIVVRQMNLVPSFRGHAKVRSVYLAYYCESCEAEKLVLVSADKFEGGKPKGIEDEIPCDKCGTGKMEPDTELARYFSFAR